MNDEPKSIWEKSRLLPHWLRAWLWITGVTYLALIMVSLFLPGGPRQGSEWLVALTAFLAAGGVIAASLLGLWACIRWLCRWRNLRRCIFGLACVVTLLALLYAEENWRGRRAWNQYQRAEEAQGTKFDFREILPAAVPEEENFAMTPVMASSYDFMLTREGKKIPSEKRDTNLVNQMDFDLGDAVGNNTNGTGSWVKGTLTDLQPWQEFYRGLANKTNLFPASPQPQTPAADVLLALRRYDKTIEELRQSGQATQSRFPLDYEAENPAGILLPHLAGLKRASLLLRLRAIAELQNGQSEKAAADVKLGLRLMEAITEPFMISHLVRIAMDEILLQPIYEGLANHQWTDAQLGTLDLELAKLDFLADCQQVQKAHLAFTVAEIAFLRNHRDYASMFAGMGVCLPGDNKMESLIYLSVPGGWFFQSTVRECQVLKQYGFAVEAATKTISPEKTAQAVQADESARAQAGIFAALRCFRQAFNDDLLSSANFLKKIARAQASASLARTAIALERYRLANGRIPESLDALVPQFMAQVPHDVIGGQALKYRPETNGQFTLYSVGWNATDDGGTAGQRKDQSGESQADFESGDWVWRYPAK